MQVFLDNSIVEIFVDERVVISSRIYPVQVDSAVNIALQLLRSDKEKKKKNERTKDAEEEKEKKEEEGDEDVLQLSSFVIWNMQDLYL